MDVSVTRSQNAVPFRRPRHRNFPSLGSYLRPRSCTGGNQGSSQYVGFLSWPKPLHSSGPLGTFACGRLTIGFCCWAYRAPTSGDPSRPISHDPGRQTRARPFQGAVNHHHWM